MPNFAMIRESRFQGVVPGEYILFKVEQIDYNAFHITENKVTQSSSENAWNAVNNRFVRSRTTRNDTNFIKMLGQNLRDESVMLTWGIETASKQGDTTSHVLKMSRFFAVDNQNHCSNRETGPRSSECHKEE
jgi:hypothetical protein